MNKLTKIHITGGTGKMGSWLKNYLESEGFKYITVSGRNKVSEETLSKSQIVFISVPISVAPSVIKETAAVVSHDCLLVDLSSVMGEVAQALKGANRPSMLVHFLFGPTVSSIYNQNIIVSRVKQNSLGDELIEVFRGSGGLVFEMTPKEHDLKASVFQNLIHFINLCTAKFLIEQGVDLSGRLSTPVLLAQLSAISRVISQEPSLLTEIQLNNLEAPEVIERFIKMQTELLEVVSKKGSQKLQEEIQKIHSKLESSQQKVISSPIKLQDQAKLRGSLAYLGPEGTFSHQAALSCHEGKKEELIPCHSLYEIFHAVKSGKADLGIVPAENSTEGTIRETLDYLADSGLKAYASVYLPVHQCLLAKTDDLTKIKNVISHPQGLAQCREFLLENLPNAILESSVSTVSEASNLSEDTALIGPEFAAKVYNLKVLRKDIEDVGENVTRFYIISAHPLKVPETSKTLIFLSIFNRVGILKDILEVLASFGINLSNIQSRPSREKLWDYCFYIEVEVNQHDSKLTEALNLLKQYCPVVKILGGV